MPDTAARRPRHWLFIVAVSATTLAGAALRFWQLRGQVLIDDEWHALRRLLSAGYRDIFTHFGWADYSIPLTAWYRLVHHHGTLDEWTMRLPMAVAGSLFPLIAIWLTRDVLDRGTRLLLAALLAISPMLVYLSRTARPYSLVAVLAFVALFAFYLAWHRRHGVRVNMALYVACTVLAAWLHLLSLACTLTPFAYFGARALWQRDPRALKGLFMVGAGLAVLLAGVLLPPVIGDWDSLTGKTGGGQVSAHSAWRTLLMMLGTRSAVAAGALVLLAGVGATWLSRTRPVLVGYLLTALIMTTALTTLLQPAWVQHPGVYARYLLPVLSIVLLLAAAGAGFLLRQLPRSMAWPTAAIGLALLVWLGPLPAYQYSPNQFMGHPLFQFDVDPRENRYQASYSSAPVPAFLHRLGERPARSLRIVETPWQLQSGALPYALYQQVHRQDVRLALASAACDEQAPADPLLADHSLRLRNSLQLSSVLQGETRGADLLVIHHRPSGLPISLQEEWPDLRDCLPRIAEHLGAPLHADDAVTVFALRDGVLR